MGYYFGLRGWLEIPQERFRAVTTYIEKLQEEAEGIKKSYLHGWQTAYALVNSTPYLFYGAEVRAEGVDLLISVVHSLIDLDIWDEDLTIEGYFHAQGEDNQRNYCVKIVDNKMTVEPDTALLI